MVLIDTGYDTAPCSLRVPDGNLCQVAGILSFSENNLGHPAPDRSPKIDAGKVPDLFKPQSVNFFCGSIEGNLSSLIARENIMDDRVWWHDGNNTDMGQRIIS